MLYLFLFLVTGVKKANVVLPEGLNSLAEYKEYGEYLQHDMELDQFEALPDPLPWEWCIMDDETETFLRIERMLDIMHSPTASQMRLQRFSTWYEKDRAGWANSEKIKDCLIDQPKDEFAIYELSLRYAIMRWMYEEVMGRCDGPEFNKWEKILADNQYNTNLMGTEPPIELQLPKPDLWDPESWHTAYPEGLRPLHILEKPRRNTSGSSRPLHFPWTTNTSGLRRTLRVRKTVDVDYEPFDLGRPYCW